MQRKSVCAGNNNNNRLFFRGSAMFDDSSMSTESSPSHSYLGSPHSSPSQQVPILVDHILGLSCADDLMETSGSPMLKIVEEPCGHFRFRYRSEMVGTHGCIVGRSSSSGRSRTFPAVQLYQYPHRAIIKCTLAQASCAEAHPHQLVEDEDDSDVSAEVNSEKGYCVSFKGMGIIHTAKKEVPKLLYKQISEKINEKFNARDLKTHCENLAKNINLNIVRLKFTAHHIDTDEEICPPVFSQPIHNMKSAATNEMKICRMDRTSGRPSGLEDVYILTEKINKKNIEIQFIELDHRGEITWRGKGRFLQSDVHHQYAIVFRTPPYKDLEITSDVKVYVELVRPSDGRRSERMEFVYRAEEVFKQRKRRKANSLSSIGSNSSGSIKSLSDVPETVISVNKLNGNVNHHAFINITLPQIPVMHSMQNNANLEEALYEEATDNKPHHFTSPMLGKGAVPEAPPMGSLLNSADVKHISADIDKLLKDSSIHDEDMRKFAETNLSDYFKYIDQDHVVADGCVDFESMGFLQASLNLKPDSGQIKCVDFESMGFLQASLNLKPDSGQIKGSAPSCSAAQEAPHFSSVDKEKSSDDYSAVYSQQDGIEVKQLVKELCGMIRTKTHLKKPIVRDKLQRLFQLRLSNGDTFLHLTICNNILPSMEYIVKLIDSLKMTHLLNETNHLKQTILHLAIINDLRRYILFLVAKGCSPMCADVEGNNAVHYAVKCGTCLAHLLDAVKASPNVECDLNACNNEKQTALHLAALHRSPHSAKLLLSRHASYSIQDESGRTPLHIAACEAVLPLIRVLLEYIPSSDIDAVDGRGHTALEIICGSQMTPSTVETVELLLAKGADPQRRDENSDSAWKMARDKPEIRELMTRYAPSCAMLEDEIKSEPEDEFESADEGESDKGLEALPAYILPVASILDRSGGWRQLAIKLQEDALLTYYQTQPSPTEALLSHTRDFQEEMTSTSLAKMLRDMGEFEAAEIILKYVDV